MNTAYKISRKHIPKLSEVGGKGLSLIKMMNKGLPVPDGFVLTVEFFQVWFDQLKKTKEWQQFKTADLKNLKKRCQALKKICKELSFTPKQKQTITKNLKGFKNRLWAVRSSSPEEDLEGASFAGGYETILGVSTEELEVAVQKCFASCLDYRIYLYKKEHGFVPDKPKIAVIVQQQIASDAAGVGFSLNPMTNCYDEAVFNANWGQGETVVSGLVSPDNFVVDKLKNQVLARNIGKKETSIWLADDGGTFEKVSEKKDTLTLSDKQLQALKKLIIKVEKNNKKPMDIEWAYAGNKLFLLQARPITTFIPLPADLITNQGNPKKLYFDLTLGIQGIHEPVSNMGIDILKKFFTIFSKEVFGKDILSDPKNGILIAKGGRVYINLSNLLHIIPQENYAKIVNIMDSITAETLRKKDISEYLLEKPPENIIGIISKILLNTPDTFGKILEGHFFPKMLEKNYIENMEHYQRKVKLISSKESSLNKFSQNIGQEIINLIVHTSIPAVVSFMKAWNEIKAMFADEQNLEIKNLLDQLTSSLPHNITVEMGLAIYQMSQLLPAEHPKNIEKLLDQINNNKLPDDFLYAWNKYMEDYGFRGPRELDISAIRYSEDPGIIANQVIQMATLKDNENNPQARYNKAQVNRYQAFEALSEIINKKSWLKFKHFQKLFKIVESLGGYRESHKYNLILGINLIRQRVLETAELLVKQGRIDKADQIFHLTVNDVDNALNNPSLDVRDLIIKRSIYWNKIKNIKNFPHLIDSRGTILMPPQRKAKSGEMVGEGVSQGTAKGKVKILNSPDEKPLLTGEVLVTRATDPGWTPLFINASAIILEVGGMLQHGALVAREYGKPCVVGINGITSLLKDGQIVEVDGTNGIVKISE